MKIYTNTFDLAQPTTKKFWVAPNSDCKIGVKLVKNGEPTEYDFTLKYGGTELSADEGKIDGFTTYTVNSGATGSREYTIEVEGQTEKLTIVQITTDSTVFDIDLQAPAGTATQEWVENYVSAETSAFVTGDGYGQAPKLSAMTSVYETDWATLSSTADENTMYVVLPDPVTP